MVALVTILALVVSGEFGLHNTAGVKISIEK